jgi:hypothetical protein
MCVLQKDHMERLVRSQKGCTRSSKGSQWGFGNVPTWEWLFPQSDWSGFVVFHWVFGQNPNSATGTLSTNQTSARHRFRKLTVYRCHPLSENTHNLTALGGGTSESKSLYYFTVSSFYKRQLTVSKGMGASVQ